MIYKPDFPKRIVCLTEETTEFLYAIGAEELIVGITKYTVRPAHAKETKPIVSRYIDANIDDIIALKPDLVLLWSNLQATIAAELIKSGIEVICFNHFDIKGILSMFLRLGSIIGKTDEAINYIENIQIKINSAKQKGQERINKPNVYFEEWYNPLITSCKWVSEIMLLCGGIDLFEEKSQKYDAKARIISHSDEIVSANPDIILASWCGAPFKKGRMLRRNNWNNIKAVENDEIYHIDSAIILQPGPASLTDGIDIVMKIFDDWELKNS